MCTIFVKETATRFILDTKAGNEVPLAWFGGEMLLGGSVVITPDGSLYPCEHCLPESRFGDIWHGITDEAALKEFCRVDRTREKCRKCPFLPDCTSLATCPVKDYHCREVHELIALDALRRMVDRAEQKKSENTDAEVPAC